MSTKYDFDVPGIVVIAGDLHCTSQEALDALLAHVGVDYDVKDCRTDKDHPHDAYWAKLKDSVLQDKVVCNACKQLSTTRGCKCHGYKCEACGTVLYKEYVKHSYITFRFREQTGWGGDITLQVHGYDDKTQSILCYPQYVESNRFFHATLPQRQRLFKQFADCFERRYSRSHRHGLIAIYYPTRGIDRDNVKINMVNHSWGESTRASHGAGYKEVSVYKGQIYPKSMGIIEHTPVPTSFSIEPTFRKLAKRDERLHATIIHAAGQTARVNYWHQDGTRAFHDAALEWMRTYVKNFTDLDYAKFDAFLKKCRLDGPGFIYDFAQWIQDETGVNQLVETQPYCKQWLNSIEGRHPPKKSRPYDSMMFWIDGNTGEREFFEEVGILPSRKKKTG